MLEHRVPPKSEKQPEAPTYARKVMEARGEKIIKSIPPGVVDTTIAKSHARRLRWVGICTSSKCKTKKMTPPVGRHLRQEGLNEEQARCGRLRLSKSGVYGSPAEKREKWPSGAHSHSHTIVRPTPHRGGGTSSRRV
jgi:hypothetical protein